jgi:hypothetical protein
VRLWRTCGGMEEREGERDDVVADKIQSVGYILLRWGGLD